MNTISICSAPVDTRSTDRKESVSFISVKASRSNLSFMVVHRRRKRRAGTENVPGIVGYGVAAERAMKSMKERTGKRNRTERLPNPQNLKQRSHM